MYFDVVIAGGSVSGLLCAREIANNHSVLVIEEDYEIGTPEHCGGLISTSALGELGIIPVGKTLGHQIESAQIFTPDGKDILVNSKKQKVLEIDRRELDKQIAYQAQKNGAVIKTKTRFLDIVGDIVKTDKENIQCKIFVDARGVFSLVQKDRTGMLPSAQYEIYADWIEKGQVKIYFDQDKFPEFFAWIIPSGEGRGKVGVAGKGINAAVTLDEFIESLGNHSVIRKIYAPIWTNGPISKFVDGNIVIVGDAAGQTKPTTAGGIYSSGMGGLFAGRAISKFLSTGKYLDLEEYQIRWSNKFGKEFERQLLARKILGRIDNKTMNKLFESISLDNVREISNDDDFDFHASSITKLLGVKGSINAIRTIIGGELRKALG